MWTDEKLKWDPAKYGNIQHIHVGSHEVWQPDILLYHRYRIFHLDSSKKKYVNIYKNAQNFRIINFKFLLLNIKGLNLNQFLELSINK